MQNAVTSTSHASPNVSGACSCRAADAHRPPDPWAPAHRQSAEHKGFVTKQQHVYDINSLPTHTPWLACQTDGASYNAPQAGCQPAPAGAPRARPPRRSSRISTIDLEGLQIARPFAGLGYQRTHWGEPRGRGYTRGLMPISRFTSSNTNQLMPAAGATFTRLGIMPCAPPAAPSARRPPPRQRAAQQPTYQRAQVSAPRHACLYAKLRAPCAVRSQPRPRRGNATVGSPGRPHPVRRTAHVAHMIELRSTPYTYPYGTHAAPCRGHGSPRSPRSSPGRPPCPCT